MQELVNKIYEDKNNSILIQSIENDIENEMQKPIEERDINLINKLISVLNEIKGIEIKSPTVSEIKAKIIKKSAEQKKIAVKKCIAVASVLMVCIFGLNIYTEKAYGTNALSVFVEIVSGRFTFNYNKNDDIIDLPTSDLDPYGLKAECKKYGIEPLLPSYIPENFKLTYSEIEETTGMIMANFTYAKGKQKIDMFIVQYFDKLPENFQISADGVYKEEIINGITMSIVDDDKEYRVVFNQNNIIYNINTKNINYDILVNILNSYQ